MGIGEHTVCLTGVFLFNVWRQKIGKHTPKATGSTALIRIVMKIKLHWLHQARIMLTSSSYARAKGIFDSFTYVNFQNSDF